MANNKSLSVETVPPVYKTFTSLSIARKWITVTEADMERQLFQATSNVTVNEILNRYAQQILLALTAIIILPDGVVVSMPC
jgi:hypothetical protein